MTPEPHASVGAITPEVADELRAMHAIARTVNGNTPLDDPRRKTNLEFTAALQSLVEQGVTVYRLAKVLGVGHASVYARLARHGYREPSPSQAHLSYRGTTTHASNRYRWPTVAIEDGAALRDGIAEPDRPEDWTPDQEIRLLRLTLKAVEESRKELRAEAARLHSKLWMLGAALDGMGTLLATSSRNWQTYRVDAWLWAVLCGWDCEEAEHTETCTHGALEETAVMHGWDEAAIAKARRYRAAVRDVTAEPQTDAVLPAPVDETPTPCGHRPDHCWGCPGGYEHCRCHADEREG